jgi:hypothetical protein
MPHAKPARRFVVCLDPGAYPASLEQWKVYRLLTDAGAERQGSLRVVDESGEDYLFPRRLFRSVRLPPAVARLYHSGRSARAASGRR